MKFQNITQRLTNLSTRFLLITILTILGFCELQSQVRHELENSRMQLMYSLDSLETELRTIRKSQVTKVTEPIIAEAIDTILETKIIDDHRLELQKNQVIRKELLRAYYLRTVKSNTQQVSLGQNDQEQLLNFYLKSIAEDLKTTELILQQVPEEKTSYHKKEPVVIKQPLVQSSSVDLHKEADLLDKIQATLMSIENLNKALETDMNNFSSSESIDYIKPSPSYIHTHSDLTGIERKKGFLPYPVTDGQIITRYGKQPHPELSEVYTDNTGIDILTKGNNKVMAVYNGTVTKIENMDDGEYLVIIAHDNNFHTLYAQMSDIKVSEGSFVDTGEALGSVSSFRKTIHFEIWNGENPENPIHWLKNN